MRSTAIRIADPSTHWLCSSSRCRVAQTHHRARLPSQTCSFSSSCSTKRAKLPESPARTRFAPSPTGTLHLGSIRTALFNYLIAKRTGGQFLLRIEDTDRKRTVPGAEGRIFQDLQWAGLEWDEGPVVGGPYGPYRQSERIPTYHKHIDTLLQNRTAYRCFCSADRIDGLNRLRHDKGLQLGYDRKCAHLSPDQAEEKAHNGEAHVVRFRVPKDYPTFVDLVYGKTGHGAERNKKLQFEEPVYDDPILMKSDGYPTYHFANVVDDELMKITHVIRGSEWMSSTPLHVALYGAFGWTPPLYGHVPLLVNEKRQKLSKRDHNTDIMTYRNGGYLPDAVTNFTALLGWSHQQKSDVMDLAELRDVFDIKFTKGNTIVSFDKLDFLQEQHTRRIVSDGGERFEQLIRDVAGALLEHYGAARISAFIGHRRLRDVIASMLQVDSIAYRNADDFARVASSVFLNDVKNRSPLEMADTSLIPALRASAAALCLVPATAWTKDVHRANLSQIDLVGAGADIAAQKKSKKEMYHYLRWALLGGATGPSIPETMEILGRDICDIRIKEAGLAAQELEIAGSRPIVKYKSQKFVASS